MQRLRPARAHQRPDPSENASRRLAWDTPCKVVGWLLTTALTAVISGGVVAGIAEERRLEERRRQQCAPHEGQPHHEICMGMYEHH